MRILITGIGGYLGWTLAQYLAERGHTVGGADIFLRRLWVEEMGSLSAIPIASIKHRVQAFGRCFGKPLAFFKCDFRNYSNVRNVLQQFRPDAIVHLAECPSAPYSMMDVEHATFVQINNVTSTLNLLFAMRECCPAAHLVKLGSMGEYGTPNISIPEGFFEIEYRGRSDRLPFPRQAGSWYHWSKVFDSQNAQFACHLWGLTVTDIMQGVVYGTYVSRDDRLATRLDFDEAFGTVINRFCCEAITGYPLTQYGSGTQRRGVLSLRDSMQCLTLALEHPPRSGDYRVFNQLREVFTIRELASLVQNAAGSLGLDVEIGSIDNPRSEAEGHYYNPDAVQLRDLGFVPTASIEVELRGMLIDLIPHRNRIQKAANWHTQTVLWRSGGKPWRSICSKVKKGGYNEAEDQKEAQNQKDTKYRCQRFQATGPSFNGSDVNSQRVSTYSH